MAKKGTWRSLVFSLKRWPMSWRHSVRYRAGKVQSRAYRADKPPKRENFYKIFVRSSQHFYRSIERMMLTFVKVLFDRSNTYLARSGRKNLIVREITWSFTAVESQFYTEHRFEATPGFVWQHASFLRTVGIGSANHISIAGSPSGPKNRAIIIGRLVTIDSREDDNRCERWCSRYNRSIDRSITLPRSIDW